MYFSNEGTPIDHRSQSSLFYVQCLESPWKYSSSLKVLEIYMWSDSTAVLKLKVLTSVVAVKANLD